ncbi:MAG TPA: glutathione S-transferase family protein [Minicystis sp.]|nr:glutathione S-transferase family protein [Minicystis sp.]
MRLHSFRASPNPLKVRVALAELDVAHEIVEVDLFRGEHRAPAFRALNPHGKVPVLEDDDGLVLRESGAILAHLGRTRGALWPRDAAGEARALQWLFFEAFHQLAIGTVWWSDRVAKSVGRPAEDEKVVAEAASELGRALGVLEAELAERPFVLAEFSLVDCALGVATNQLVGTRLDDGRFPKSFAYAHRFRARPSWRAAGGDGIHQFG